MSEIDYNEYIAGEDWRIRRRDYLRKFSHCAMCGMSDEMYKRLHRRHLDVHHLSYARLGGAELDDDLMALCRACHKKRESGKVTPVHPPGADFTKKEIVDTTPAQYWEMAVSQCEDVLARVNVADRDDETVWRQLWAKEFAESCLKLSREAQ